jgi:hypothetical protein
MARHYYRIIEKPERMAKALHTLIEQFSFNEETKAFQNDYNSQRTYTVRTRKMLDRIYSDYVKYPLGFKSNKDMEKIELLQSNLLW